MSKSEPANISLAMNEALYRSELLRQLLDPGRNIDQECGYPSGVTPQEYRQLFEREGFAARLVSIFPEECWASPPSVYETEDEENATPFEEKLTTLIKKKRLWHYMERLDILSGVGRFGVLLIGIDDGKELHEEVEGFVGSLDDARPRQTPRKLLYLKPFDEAAVQIDTWEKDVTNPRYGMPLHYKIIITNYAATKTESTTVRVHWHRVIHAADLRMNSDVYGTPRMESALNRIFDVRKIAGGAGEMFWKGGFPGYATEIDADTSVDGEEIKKEIQQYQQGLQRWLMLQGVKVTPLTPQVADPTGHLKAAIMLAALSKGIPYRIFMGTEEAQLAGSQDALAWKRRIHRRNTNYVGPMLVEEFITRLVSLGILPVPTQGFVVKYPDPDNLTEEQKASIADKQTSALAKYVQGNVETVMPLPEYLSIVLKLPSAEIKQILASVETQILDDQINEEEQEIEDEDDTEEDEA